MQCNMSLFLYTTAEQMNICTVKIQCISRLLQTNWIYALPHFIMLTDNCRTREYMQCYNLFYLQTTADQLNILHCHISLYLQITADQLNICTATFHFILQTTADQLNICTAKFHFIYRHLQANWIYALPHFILFTDNCRPTEYMHCHISLYLQTTTCQLKQYNKLYRYSLIFCITTSLCIYFKLAPYRPYIYYLVTVCLFVFLILISDYFLSHRPIKFNDTTSMQFTVYR